MEYKSTNCRTGHRTLRGIASDGLNSLVRYFLNNFVDGDRQNAFSFFSGESERPERSRGGLRGLFLLFLLLIVMLFCGPLFAIVFAVIVFSAVIMLHLGGYFVSLPATKQSITEKKKKD